ncbi:DUF1617 family protein [Clostridium intestinale]|uniref:Phage protein n=1 Tax=Clostridium intestinale DSM 6191 TaxID=1121320 RepID=A0A1M5TZ53_9CLOT|nr:DUF1617 family protein [Clostridium intestinale]SHH56057.1 Protein of unknown function [Clostridium intestinale DSM 6191]
MSEKTILSNRKIVDDINNLKAISDKQLPVKVSYAIAKNIAKIEADLKIFYKERAKLIDKYVQKEEDGTIKVDSLKNLVFKDSCKEKWDKEIEELLEAENEIDIHKFNMDLLEGYSMKPLELMVIDYMIEE